MSSGSIQKMNANTVSHPSSGLIGLENEMQGYTSTYQVPTRQHKPVIHVGHEDKHGESINAFTKEKSCSSNYRNIVVNAFKAVKEKKKQVLFEKCPTCKQQLRTLLARNIVKKLLLDILKSLNIDVKKQHYGNISQLIMQNKERKRPAFQKGVSKTLTKNEPVSSAFAKTVKDKVKNSFLRQRKRVSLENTLRSVRTTRQRLKKGSSCSKVTELETTKFALRNCVISKTSEPHQSKTTALKINSEECLKDGNDIGLIVKNEPDGEEEIDDLESSYYDKMKSVERKYLKQNSSSCQDRRHRRKYDSTLNQPLKIFKRTFHKKNDCQNADSRKLEEAVGTIRKKIIGNKCGIKIETGVKKQKGDLYACKHCSRSFTTERGKIQHEKSHKVQNNDRSSSRVPYICETCGKSFSTKEYIKRHQLSHSKLKKRSNLCRYCSKTFADLKDLVPHEKTHTGEKPYVCDLCNMRFAAQSSLSRHLILHTGIKSFLCEQCGKAFKTKSELKRHGMTHTAQRPFKCDLCEKCFTSKNNMISHRLTHTGEKPYTCSVCNKTFARHFLLTVHMRIHTGERPYKCPHCPRTFAQNSNYRKHLKVHTINEKLKGKRSYSCDICQKAFFSEVKLCLHLDKHSRIEAWKMARQVEIDARTIQCDICHQKFTNRRSLQRHKRVHTGNWPYTCDHCGKGCNYKRELDVHLRSHTGEKPFICTECPKTFAKKLLLTMHMRIHTGERPYKCTQCPRAFTQSSNLKKHIRNRHALRPNIYREGYSIAFCYAPSSQTSQPPSHSIATINNTVPISTGNNKLPSGSNPVQENQSVQGTRSENLGVQKAPDHSISCIVPQPRLESTVTSYSQNAIVTHPHPTQPSGTVQQDHLLVPPSSITLNQTQPPVMLQHPTPHEMHHITNSVNVNAQQHLDIRAPASTIPQHFHQPSNIQFAQYMNHTIHMIDPTAPSLAVPHPQALRNTIQQRNGDYPSVKHQISADVYGSQQILQQHPLAHISHPVQSINHEQQYMLPQGPSSREAESNMNYHTLQALGTHMHIPAGQVPMGYNKDVSQTTQHSTTEQAILDEQMAAKPEIPSAVHNVREVFHQQSSKDSRIIECQVCRRRFNDIRSLHRHERLHTGVWPFTCGVCGKGCSYRGELERHERGHTGEKPHACQACGKEYALLRSLKRHMETAHRDCT